MLELDGLERRYPGFALGPVSLTVGEGTLAVLGPSGCGKTTLLSTVAGIEAADAGTVTLDGTDVTGRPPEERGAALLFQDGALFPHMTARENIAYAAADPGQVATLAERLEVAGVLDRRPEALSGGQRQRVALARSLAADPGALLLDEPLANLDPPVRRRLAGEMRDLLDGLGVPVLYVTHDRHEATVVGDRLGVMEDGVLRQVGTPEEVFERPEDAFVAAFTGNDNVFEGTARADGIAWGERRLAADVGRAPGTAVTFCVRPERVEVGDRGENPIGGTVEALTYEGTGYRVAVEVEGAPVPVTARIRPGVRDHHDIEMGGPISVSLPPGAIHVIGPADPKV
ncbi:MAG: ABC transporter ATP-binding protein [Halobacteriales archaeon]